MARCPQLWGAFLDEYWEKHERSLSDELAVAGGDGLLIAALLRELASTNDPCPLEKRLIDAVERCWERLHIGPWQDVPPCWRRAYGVCAFLASQVATLALVCQRVAAGGHPVESVSLGAGPVDRGTPAERSYIAHGARGAALYGSPSCSAGNHTRLSPLLL
jgi:hypothetical protein